MRRYFAQTSLVVLGVGIGVANIILLMSMTDMSRRQTLGLLEQFGARVLIIMPFVDLAAGPTALFSQANNSGHLPGVVYQALRTSPSVSIDEESGEHQASAMLALSAHVTAPAESWFTTVAGATAQVDEFGGFELAAGRWISLEDEQQQARRAVLGYLAEKELFKHGSAVGQNIRIKGQEYEVIGVLKHKASTALEENDKRVFIPLSTAQELFQFDGVHGVLARYRHGMDEDAAIAAVRGDIAAVLPEGASVDDTVSIFTVHEATKLMDRTLGIFRTVLLGVASIALVVAGIGIMNVMLIRVLRRRGEIGLRRAVGATTRSIVGQFIIESAVQALTGALVGLVIGAVGLGVFASVSDWTFYISPRTLLIAVSFGGMVGVLFGAYPAWTAAKVDPIKSLRFEQ
jgi:putative ABC transport system permease protein